MSIRRTTTLLGLTLLAAASSGFTNCKYFSDVTVPTSDSKPPIAVSRVFIDGEETLRIGSITEYITDPGAIIFAIGSIYDRGGARSVTMTHRVRVYCHNYSTKPQMGQLIFVEMFPISASQPGTVGSTVSDGIYVYHSLSLEEYTSGYCAKGYSLEEISYYWQISGEDFHGNSVALSGTNAVIYAP